MHCRPICCATSLPVKGPASSALPASASSRCLKSSGTTMLSVTVLPSAALRPCRRRRTIRRPFQGDVLAPSPEDPVHPLAFVRLLRGDGQATLLLQRAGEGSSNCVCLPPGGGHDLGNGGALGAAQH